MDFLPGYFETVTQDANKWWLRELHCVFFYIYFLLLFDPFSATFFFIIFMIWITLDGYYVVITKIHRDDDGHMHHIYVDETSLVFISLDFRVAVCVNGNSRLDSSWVIQKQDENK